MNTGNRRGLPPAGRVLSRLTGKDLKPFIERGIARYRADYRDSDVFIFREILDTVVRCDRVLTTPGGSLLLAGRSGVGRRTAVGIVASMNNMKLFSPKVSRSYGVKQFKNDLKTVSGEAQFERCEVTRCAHVDSAMRGCGRRTVRAADGRLPVRRADIRGGDQQLTLGWRSTGIVLAG